MHRKNSRGFTLIELLVVIAIIALLSTIILASLQSAESKAQDAEKVEDVLSVEKALNLFYTDNHRMPLNYDLVNSSPQNACDNSADPTGQNAYLESMQELVDDHALAQIPRTISGTTPFCYLDVGSRNAIGALFWTQLNASVPGQSAEGSCNDWLGFADMNGDGVVDSTTDYPLWSAYLGQTGINNPQVDFNRDGTVDLSDRSYVLIKINHSPLPCTQSPSPTHDFCACVEY